MPSMSHGEAIVLCGQCAHRLCHELLNVLPQKHNTKYNLRINRDGSSVTTGSLVIGQFMWAAGGIEMIDIDN